VTWCATAHFDVRVRRRARERGPTQDRQVGPVVAHRRDAIPAEAEAVDERRRRRHLVGRAVGSVEDAEVGHAPAHRGRIATGDDDRDDAGVGKELHALAVERRKGLERLAGGADVDAAVGEDAVDVEDRRADAGAGAARRKQKARRELERGRDRQAGRGAARKSGRAALGGSHRRNAPSGVIIHFR